MDSDLMNERSHELIYGSSCTFYTGRDFLTKPKPELQTILETVVFTNTGESILKAVFDRSGDIVPF
jgi:hypothetical protein